jgi:hypothetical protein
MPTLIFLAVWSLVVFLLSKDFSLFVYIPLSLGLLYQAKLWSFKKETFYFFLAVGLVGWSLESVESYFGYLKIMNSHPQPLWIVFLWAYFSSYTFTCFSFFVDRYAKAFLYGAYSLPGSYFLVSKLGLAELSDSLTLFFIVNGTVGGLVLMFAHYMFYNLQLNK